MFQMYNLITYNVHTDTCAQTNKRKTCDCESYYVKIIKLDEESKKLKELYQE